MFCSVLLITRLLFGTLYPAYCSYKAVKTKNVKEYVRWMMYWIVFAIFTCAETFADIFISWLPFYYEIKIFYVIWLMLPATRGATILYKKFIHPQLSKREEEIDKCIAKASDQGYSTLLNLGSKSFNFAASIVLATAIKVLSFKHYLFKRFHVITTATLIKHIIAFLNFVEIISSQGSEYLI
ncbi:hypothetical protein HELRODRAFT_65616 [Helobdella robusta]|uniref:Receptor expression-enhancing protein n=1 Tax=Helobdella robusta TaxID=6412 RepID=T1FYA6_HELRO|nr:hypothetical protein HELRODRAFT_65616 [Helobdella robusta]ESO02210.1 hypothetical protein HELRODRAFT_65616 [Helobdella robusta]